MPSLVHMSIPMMTAFLLALAGGLIVVSCLLSKLSDRLSVPVSLLFLLIGMLAGSDGVVGYWINSHATAYILGTFALIVILFVGGLSTHGSKIRSAILPSFVLATVGVFLVALITTLGAIAAGLNKNEALLFGAVVSSTDAAAVFASLRGVRLKDNLGSVIELESGLNDPVAVLLATIMTYNLLGTPLSNTHIFELLLYEMVVGAALGIIIGYFAVFMLRSIPINNVGLYPVATLGVCLFAYGLPTWINASGFMSVYLAGIVIGNGKLPYHAHILSVSDSLAWLAQVAMYLMLGLLVVPSELSLIAVMGIGLALFVAIVSRPLAVALCLLPFRFKWRQILCVSWLGLRGATPIILATVPILSAPEGTPQRFIALKLFNLVFFVVVVGSFIPGTTVTWFTRYFKLADPVPPEPLSIVDAGIQQNLDATQLTVFISHDSKIGRKRIGELKLPPDTVVMLILRGTRMLPAPPDTIVLTGDCVYIMCPNTRKDEVLDFFSASGDPVTLSNTGSQSAAAPAAHT